MLQWKSRNLEIWNLSKQELPARNQFEDGCTVLVSRGKKNPSLFKKLIYLLGQKEKDLDPDRGTPSNPLGVP